MTGQRRDLRGSNWVVLAVIVRLPFCDRPVALPVLAKLVVKGTNSASRLWLARGMTQLLADALPGRRVHVVADSACAGEELRKLGTDVTWRTRLRKDAALHELPPARVPRSCGTSPPAATASGKFCSAPRIYERRYRPARKDIR
jgi:hypothetical protein